MILPKPCGWEHDEIFIAMRKQIHLWPLLALCLTVALSFLSCEKPDDPHPTPTPVDPTEAAASGVYVLCEGLMDYNNTTLAFYNFENGTLDPDLFLTVNGRGLATQATTSRPTAANSTAWSTSPRRWRS